MEELIKNPKQNYVNVLAKICLALFNEVLHKTVHEFIMLKHGRN